MKSPEFVVLFAVVALLVMSWLVLLQVQQAFFLMWLYPLFTWFAVILGVYVTVRFTRWL